MNHSQPRFLGERVKRPHIFQSKSKKCSFINNLGLFTYILIDFHNVYSGIELIAAFYGCLYVGCVPVTIRPPHPQNIATTLPTVKMIVEVSKASAILTSSLVLKLMKSKVCVII